MKKCTSPICNSQIPRRKLFCVACWHKIPNYHQDEVRKGTAKGAHTLRSLPAREWIAKAFKYISPHSKVEGVNESVTSSVMKVEFVPSSKAKNNKKN